MSWNGACPFPFRCITSNRPRSWVVGEEEVGRQIDYRVVRELFKYIYPHEWSPLAAAFLSDTNLMRVSRELARRVMKATGQNVFIELDKDESLSDTFIDLMHRNLGRDWTTDGIRIMNEHFLEQATHDIVYGIRQRFRNERLLNMKTGRNYLAERPLHRYMRKGDIPLDTTYWRLNHPFAKSNNDLEAFQKQQLYGEKPHGVLIHAPYYWR